ncbi:hypothetical protein NDU88_003644 [Pleurodeles waltl]|uniref:Uncharacterized protein n=1 Tax=Pleurodeles waltl TaxID=8319 RepID=A0AAV7T662_PLEWA|nr:hypothetical protein NDU88_003644 [Pleurodeles waltl]
MIGKGDGGSPLEAESSQEGPETGSGSSCASMRRIYCGYLVLGHPASRSVQRRGPGGESSRGLLQSCSPLGTAAGDTEL